MTCVKAGILLKAFFSLCFFFASPVFALEENSAIEIPEELSGAKDVVELENIQESLVDETEAEPLERYKNFLDSVNKIRMSRDEENLFSAVQKDSGKRVLTSSANGKVQRRFYDQNLRLDKIEYWSVSGSSANGSLDRVVTYNKPSGTDGLSSIFEKNYADSTETRTFYHKNGSVKSRRKNFFDKDGRLVSFEIYTCSYDSSWRPVQDRLQKFAVDGKDVSLSSDETHVTKYSGKNILETSYYKNSVLRVRTFYIDGKSDEYARATYFDGGIIVRDFYRGNIKISSTVDNGDFNGN